MRLLPLLAIVLCLWHCAASASVEDGNEPSVKPLKKCNNLCAVCQSLQQAQELKVCAGKLLNTCGCEKFAIDYNTSRTASPESIVNKDCPSLKKPAGFCYKGQAKDPKTLCPTPECSVGPSCSQDWHKRCPKSTWCPHGYQLDSETGCPLCECACPPKAEALAVCNEICTASGAEGQLIPAPHSSTCAKCLCKKVLVKKETVVREMPSNCPKACPNNCGRYGHRNTTLNSAGCVTDCACRCPRREASLCPAACDAVKWVTDSHGCEVCQCAEHTESRWCPPAPKCPNRCGPHGFRVVGACRKDCECACPTARCPADCRGSTVWRTDSYGCASCHCGERQNTRVAHAEGEEQCPPLRCATGCGALGFQQDSRGCATCKCRCPPVSASNHCPGSSCAKWGSDERGCATCLVCHAQKPCVTMANFNVTEICPKDCSEFFVRADSRGCLTCGCESICPREPRCLVGCGPHRRKKDNNGCVTTCDCECPVVTRETCRRSCSHNATIVTDPYGCKQCQCERCPNKLRCTNNCGHLGYQAGADGCQLSCKCNCPPRRCNCIFGSRLDAFGCETCQCKTLADFHDFFNLNNN